MAGKGRPGPPPGTGAAVINKEQALELAKRQWYIDSIASFFGVDKVTLYRHIPATEIQQARQDGVTRLREALFTRAMGGRVEKKNEDGTITVTYLKSSDRLLKHALDRFDGSVAQRLDLNPDPEKPANVKHSVDPELLKNAITELESEF